MRIFLQRFRRYNLKNDLSILCEKYGSDKGYVNFKKDTPYGWKR